MTARQNQTDTPRHFVTALARGLEILRCFDRPRATLSVADISRRTGLSQPTTWRLCQTLIDCGYLNRSDGTLLTVGAPVLTLGFAAVAGSAPAEIALPVMRHLSQMTGGTASLSRRHDTEMIFVERTDGKFVRPNMAIGWSVPLTAVATGLSVLAALPQSARDQVALELAANDVNWERHRDRMEQAVEHYQKNGFVTFTHQMEGPYTAIAVPLFADGTDPKEQWALSCGGIGSEWSGSVLDSAVNHLLETRRNLSPAFATFG